MEVAQFSFVLAGFEIGIRYQSGDVEQAVVSLSQEL